MLKLFCIYFFLFSKIIFSYEIPKPPKQNIQNEEIKFLQKISKGLSYIAKKSQNAVVFINVERQGSSIPYGHIDPFEYFFKTPNKNEKDPNTEHGLGSGFIFDLQKGYILTNNHVVDKAKKIFVKTTRGENFEAEILGKDDNTDCAVLQVKQKWNPKGLSQLYLDDSDDADVGDLVVALGAPFGLEASISLGVVSAVGRGNLSITKVGNFIQTDAAINPGNSGGPLLNVFGNVVGINTAIYSRTGGYNGIGFAIPSSLIKKVALSLIEQGKLERGYIGLAIDQLNEALAKDLGLTSNEGVIIVKVENNSPAAKVGIMEGDVVLRMNGKSIKDARQLSTLVGLMNPGAKIDLEIFRDQKILKKNILIEKFDDRDVKK